MRLFISFSYLHLIVMFMLLLLFFFFFNDTATTEIYTLSLHDALPILFYGYGLDLLTVVPADRVPSEEFRRRRWPRSEEHTSELQSQSNLVCRLLLEKKKPIQSYSHPLF